MAKTSSDCFSSCGEHPSPGKKSLQVGRFHNYGKPRPHGYKPLKRVRSDEYYSLARIMQSLKGYTALQANPLLGRNGEFWAHESYDHWIRNATERQRIVAYVLNNPVKAGYVRSWQDWAWSYRRCGENAVRTVSALAALG